MTSPRPWSWYFLASLLRGHPGPGSPEWATVATCSAWSSAAQGSNGTSSMGAGASAGVAGSASHATGPASASATGAGVGVLVGAGATRPSTVAVHTPS